MTTLTVYVPNFNGFHTSDEARAAIIGILPRSAIVGSPRGDGRVLIDFEANKYNAVNLRRYDERLRVAAGRHVDHYPTVARMLVKAEVLTEIGTYDTETGQLIVTNRTELERWDA